MIGSGFDRGARGVGVRDLLVVFPSVGCTNRTVEEIGREHPDAVILTHQHGCGQLGGDLDVTADTLAGVCANPNVRAALIVGLGCESNAPVALRERAAARGATVDVTVFQENGGLAATVKAAGEALDRFRAVDPRRRPVEWTDVSVGVLVDAQHGDDHWTNELAARVADALRSRGATPFVASAGASADLDHHLRATTSVPATWTASDRAMPPAGASVQASGVVEQLAEFAARGAQLCVVLSGRINPLGSPIVPTLKVATTASAMTIASMVDVDASGPEDDTAADRVIAALQIAIGDPVAAELAGQSDFGIPRFAPTM
jgi:altronate dehydratase